MRIIVNKHKLGAGINMLNDEKSDMLIYTDNNGEIKIRVNLVEDTVWLTQNQLSDLYDKNVRTISEHINNIFNDGELEKDTGVRKFRITGTDGKT